MIREDATLPNMDNGWQISSLRLKANLFAKSKDILVGIFSLTQIFL